MLSRLDVDPTHQQHQNAETVAGQTARQKITTARTTEDMAGQKQGQAHDHPMHGPAVQLDLSNGAAKTAAPSEQGLDTAPVSLAGGVVQGSAPIEAGFQAFVDSAMSNFVADVAQVLESGFGLPAEEAGALAQEIVFNIGGQMGQDAVLEAEFTSVASSQQVSYDNDGLTVEASLIMRQIDFAYNRETGDLSLSIQEAKVAAKVDVDGLKPGDAVDIDLGLSIVMGPEGIDLGVTAEIAITNRHGTPPPMLGDPGQEFLSDFTQGQFNTFVNMSEMLSIGQDTLAMKAAQKLGLEAELAKLPEEQYDLRIADLNTLYEEAFQQIKDIQSMLENMIHFAPPIPAADPTTPAVQLIRLDALIPVEMKMGQDKTAATEPQSAPTDGALSVKA